MAPLFREPTNTSRSYLSTFLSSAGICEAKLFWAAGYFKTIKSSFISADRIFNDVADCACIDHGIAKISCIYYTRTYIVFSTRKAISDEHTAVNPKMLLDVNLRNWFLVTKLHYDREELMYAKKT